MATGPSSAEAPPGRAEPGHAEGEGDPPRGWTERLAGAPWVASTYFAEGLPYSLVHQVSMELFTAMGASSVVVGLTSLYGLPWNLKFLWGPLVDRYGTMRRWVVALELLLAAACALVAWPAQRLDLGLCARIFLVVAVLAATHDVAVDGFYMRALDKERQASLSGLRPAAFRVAMLAGKSGLVVLAGKLSWQASFFAGAGMLLLLGAAHAAVLPREEKTAERADPRPLSAVYGEALRTFLAMPGAWISLAFIVTYRAGDALMFAMSSKFLAHLGVGLAARGVLNGWSGVAGIAGSIGGGAVIARLGMKRTLAPIALLQGVAILLYGAVAVLRPGIAGVSAAVIVEQTIAGVGASALVVFLMSRCSGQYKASHFALASALMSLATTGFGTASGFLQERLGFAGFFALAYLAAVPGILLSLVVPKE